MTLNATGWNITCNFAACDAHFVAGGGTGANVAQVRAAQHGWWVNAKIDYHLCPAHAPTDGPDSIVMVSP
jgi:hypothetical protein